MKFNSFMHSIAFFLWSEYYELKYFFIYRGQSAIWLIYSLFTSFYSLITLTIIYNVSSGIAGWSYFQILALSYTASIVLSVFYTVLNPWKIAEAMRTGRMDTFLIRPYGIMTLLLSGYGEITSLGGLAGSVAVFAFAMLHVGVAAIPFAAYLLIMVAGTIALTIFMIMLTILFYHLFKSADFVNRLVGVLSTAGSYPLNIFGPFLLLVFTVVLPIGIASYYPSEALFGKISLVPYLEVLALIFAVTILSYKGTKALMKYYASGGG